MNWKGVLQLLSNGTVDSGFDLITPVDGAALCAVERSDGVLLVGGDFTRRILKVSNSGVIDAWDPQMDNAVQAMLAQADQRLIVVGLFEQASGLNRGRALRLSAGLAVEPAYDPSSGGALYAIAAQSDGKTLVGGTMSAIGGESREGVARLRNDSAETTLTVHSASRVSWLRGGASVEASRVRFEVDDGSGYALLSGTPRRIPGGWELTGLTLSGTGSLRATVYPGDSHSSGALEALRNFDFSPEISVLLDANDVASGGTLSFGSVQNGSVSTRTLTIQNTGLADLTITLPVVLSGTAAGSYSILQAPVATVAPGASTTCIVRLAPTTEGAKPALLTITNDDASEGTYTINLNATVTAGPGGIDPSWQPTANGEVVRLGFLNDRLLCSGAFTTISGVSSRFYAGLQTNSITPQWLGATSSAAFQAILPLESGHYLVGGGALTIRGVTRNGLARLNADGTVDPTFNPNLTGGTVRALAVDSLGRIYVAGNFTQVGTLAATCLVRLTPTGALDVGYAPRIAATIESLSLTADEKLLVSGYIVLTGDITKNGVMRLTTSGALDPTFVFAGWSESGSASARYSYAQETQDGKLLAYSYKSAPWGLRRYSTTGAIDATFTALELPAVNGLALQADGAVIVARGLVALDRYTAASVQDATFVSSPAARVASEIMLDKTGRVYVGQVTAPQLVRLINQPGTESLTVPSADRVQWLRGGSTPEAQYVIFELSQDAGVTWTRLGLGVRMSGGWELTGLTLPRNGRVRGRARTHSGLFDSVTVFADLPVPDLDVETASGSVIVPSGVLDFGPLLPRLGSAGGQTTDITITLRNTGGAEVTGLALSATGDWAVVSLGSVTLLPLQSTTAVIRYAPTAVGVRSGELTVASNVPGIKGRYKLTLTGTGIAAPTATTTSATNVTFSQARLRGSIRANAPSSVAWVEYKRTESSVWLQASLPTQSGFASVPVEVNVSGLTAATPYHYRLAVYNSVNTAAAPSYGAIVPFNTAAS